MAGKPVYPKKPDGQIAVAKKWLIDHVVLRVRQDLVPLASWNAVRSRWTYAPSKQWMKPEVIEQHLNNNPPIGAYLLPYRSETVMTAALDIDDHDGSAGFDIVREAAALLAECLEARGLIPWACRSGGGSGIHLWMFWEKPQNAAKVRKLLYEVLEAAGVSFSIREGRKLRVREKEVGIDVFPAQDRLEDEQVGNLIALPLARNSAPLDTVTWEPIESYDTLLSPPMSCPVEDKEHLQRLNTSKLVLSAGVIPDAGEMEELLSSHVAAGVGEAEAYQTHTDDLRSMLTFVSSDDYFTWVRVGLALKGASADGQMSEDEALQIWLNWSSKATEKYDETVCRREWRRFRPRAAGSKRVTLGSIVYLALQSGWTPPKRLVQPKAADSTDGSPPISTTEAYSSAATEPITESVDALEKFEARWTKGKPDDHIEMLNEKHFVVIDGGKLCVMREDFDAVMRRHKLTRLSVADFRTYFLNRKVQVGQNRSGPIFKSLGDVWLEDDLRRQYRDMVFDPTKTPRGCYNLWRGFTVKARPGDCGLFKEHVLNNICSGDHGIYEYIMSWLALCVQKPAQPAGTAIVLRGNRGTGKGTFVRTVGELFGQHFLHVTNSRYITGQFNSHLRDCVLLFADEAVWAGSKSEESTLKGLVTEPTVAIEGKGRDIVTCRNMIHLIIATNNDWAVPAGLDERRFVVLEVSDARKQDKSYFTAITRQLENGGFQALLHELMDRDLSDFDVFNVPRTQELLRQKLLSLDPWLSWWFEKLQEGRVCQYQQNWSDDAVIADIYQDYVRHCRDAGLKHPGTVEGLAINLRSMVTGGFPAVARKTMARRIVEEDGGVTTKNERVRCWVFPDLVTCRELFEKAIQQKVPWQVSIGSETTKDDVLMDF